MFGSRCSNNARNTSIASIEDYDIDRLEMFVDGLEGLTVVPIQLQEFGDSGDRTVNNLHGIGVEILGNELGKNSGDMWRKF